MLSPAQGRKVWNRLPRLTAPFGIQGCRAIVRAAHTAAAAISRLRRPRAASTRARRRPVVRGGSGPGGSSSPAAWERYGVLSTAMAFRCRVRR